MAFRHEPFILHRPDSLFPMDINPDTRNAAIHEISLLLHDNQRELLKVLFVSLQQTKSSWLWMAGVE